MLTEVVRSRASVVAFVVGVAMLALCGAPGASASRPTGSFPLVPSAQATRAVDGLHKATPQDRAGKQPDTPDSYVYLKYGDEVVREITVTLGAKFVLDMNLNGGSNPDNSAQQSYLSFSSSLLQVVPVPGTDCTPGFELEPDVTMFDFVLQNELCNGPQPCDLRGMRVPAGSIAYASGGLEHCYSGCGGDFRVARLAMCGIRPGRAVLHWQFAPPDVINRDCEIVAFSGELVQKRPAYHDLVVNVVSPVEPSPTATPCALPFGDVSGSDYFYDAVRYLYCNGAISGYGDNTYRPSNNVTRAQLTKIVVLANGWPVDTEGGPHFLDVPESNPFYTYVETAYRNLAVTGYSDRTFRPGNNITREQLCKVISLAEGWPLSWPPAASFRDVAVGSPFFTYVETAYCHGIVSGYADRTFRPSNNATRGQVAKIVYGSLRAAAPCK